MTHFNMSDTVLMAFRREGYLMAELSIILAVTGLTVTYRSRIR
jgi:hypothetical protein